MFGTILVFFCILAIIMSLLFVCVCVGGMMGILGLVAPFLLKILSFGFDKRYSEENQPINNECFICLEKISDEVVATCNHSYCGECITQYIQANSNSSINCPACRKQILVLFRRFEASTEAQKNIKKFISQYNCKYTKQPGFFRAIAEFGNTIRHLPMLFSNNGLRYLLSDQRLKYILLLAIYALSPIDILPEAILGPLGLIDDGIAVSGLIRMVSTVLYGYLRQQSRIDSN